MNNEQSPAESGVKDANSDSSEGRTLKTSLEVTGKMLAGFAGLCYVTGLLVVTVHLSELGLNSLVLSQLHYVMAGVWALLPIILGMFLTIVATYYAAEEIQKTRPDQEQEAPQSDSVLEGGPSPAPKRPKISAWVSIKTMTHLLSKRNRQIAATVFGSVFGIGFLLWLLSRWVGIQPRAWWILALPIGALVGWLSLAEVYSLTRITGSTPIMKVGEIMITAFVCLLLFFGYVVLFARKCYTDIPWSTGGGKPSQVRLVIEPEFGSYLASVGIPVSKGESRAGESSGTLNKAEFVSTNPTTLLLTTDKQLVVLNNVGKPVSLSADVVKVVLYDK